MLIRSAEDGNKWKVFFTFLPLLHLCNTVEIQQHFGPLIRKFTTNEIWLTLFLFYILYVFIRLGNSVRHIRGAAAFLINTDTLTFHRRTSLGGESGGEEHFLISTALTLITRGHPWVLPVCPVQTQA